MRKYFILVVFALIQTFAAAQCNPEIIGDTILCEGVNSTILDAGPGYDHYLWSPGGANTQTITVSSIGIQYSVQVSNDAPSCVGTDTVLVRYADPIIPILTATSNFACSGEEIQMTVTGAGAGGTYLWGFGLGTDQIIDLIVNQTRIYTVELTSVYGCIENGAIVITEVEYPDLELSPITETICKSTSIEVSATGAETYLWFPSYGLPSTTDSIMIASPEVTTEYLVTGSNEDGGKVCSVSETMNIIVDDFAFSLPLDQTVCKGEKLSIVASVSGGIAPYTFEWTINNLPRIEILPVILDTITGERHYKLIGEDGNGCVITKNATFKNYPDLVFEPFVNEDSVCPNDPVLFNASISGGTGMPYEFIFDGHFSNTVLTVYPKETYTYYLVASDACEELKDSIVITTYPVPYIDFSADFYNGCAPKSTVFSPISSPSGLLKDYRWNFGDNDDNNLSIAANPTHVYNKRGNYNVTLGIYTIDGCYSDTTKEALIHVDPKPSVSFIPEPVTVSILDPKVFFNNTTEGADSLTYIWDFGTGDLSNVKSPEFDFDFIGHYEVELIGFTQYGCSDTTYKFVEVKPEIKLYVPTAFTPDGDFLNDNFKPEGVNIINKNYNFKIYDRYGMKIFETENFHEGWDGRVNEGDIAQPGVYVYSIIYRDIYGIEYTKEGSLTLIK